jgi:hypothetical protein
MLTGGVYEVKPDPPILLERCEVKSSFTEAAARLPYYARNGFGFGRIQSLVAAIAIDI